MAQKKISQLSDSNLLTLSADLLPIVNEGSTRKITVEELLGYVPEVWTDLQELSGNWESTATVVQANSASWAVDSTIDTEMRDLSANWQETYTTFRDASSTFLTSETDSQTLSFDDLTKDLSISNGNTISLSALVDSSIDTGVRDLSANWQDTLTVVQANSASWAVDSTIDTEMRDLSGNWESTATIVQANSASWAVDSTIDTEMRDLSGGWQDTLTVVQANSASWEESAEVLTTVTDYLSSNTVLVSDIEFGGATVTAGDALTNSLSSLTLTINGQQYKIPLLSI